MVVGFGWRRQAPRRIRIRLALSAKPRPRDLENIGPPWTKADDTGPSPSLDDDEGRYHGNRRRGKAGQREHLAAIDAVRAMADGPLQYGAGEDRSTQPIEDRITVGNNDTVITSLSR